MQITSDYIRECFCCFDDNTLIWKERPIHHFASEKSWEDWCESFAFTRVNLANHPTSYVTQIGIRTTSGLVFTQLRTVLLAFGKSLPVLKSKLLERYRNHKAIFDLGNRLSMFGAKHMDGKWMARLSVNGGQIYLGMFETRREAQRAVFDKIESYYGVKL